MTGGPFALDGRVAVVTGATGALGGAIARGLADAGATVCAVARRADRLRALVAELEDGGRAAAFAEADVLDATQLAVARDRLVERFGRIDILVNAAGGNRADALTGERTFFEVPREALEAVVDLNLMGTVLPTQVLGAAMAAAGDAPEGGRAIVNVSSMAAGRALTRVGGYGAAKAGVESLTRWLAVDLARGGAAIRVNAVAPGFFIGEQNRDLLLEPDGRPTARGARILEATPLGRFGEPHELVGTVVWLCSAAASFVTGAVIPVDGGFGAFSGV